MNISMISSKNIYLCLVAVLNIVGFSYGLTTPQEVLSSAKSIAIEVNVFSGRGDPVYKLDDSVSVKAITNRLSMILENAEKLKSVGCAQVSNLGYRGMVMDIGDSIHQITVVITNGKISLSPSPISSYIYCLSDSGRELERLVAKSGAKNKLTSINGAPAVAFVDVVPKELYQPVTSYGIATMDDMSDSFAIDFSSLKFANIILKNIRSGYDPVFRDILIRRLLEVSYSPLAYLIEAPYAIAGIDSVEKTAGKKMPVSSYFTQSRDSLLRYFLPVIDSAQKHPELLQYGPAKQMTGNIFPRAYVIKISEGGLAFFANVGMYIGGIDRICLFWIYTDQNSFDVDALRGLIDPPTGIDYGIINRDGKTYPIFSELFNLKGQTLKRSSFSSGTLGRISPAGIIVKKNVSGKARCEVMIKR